MSGDLGEPSRRTPQDNAAVGALGGGAQTPVQRTDLQENALGLTSVVMQSVTHIAPAIAILFTIQFNASQAGQTAPLSYLLAFLVVLVLGVVLAQLARHLPSAGGYYTYVSRAVSPRAGFLVAWLYTLYSPIVAAPVLTAIGFVVENELKSEYGITVPWWAFLLVALSLLAFLLFRGVTISARVMVVAGLIEIVLVMALALQGFVDPGPGGVSLEVFDPANAPSGNGLYLAVIFSIFAITGWESAAPLAEESRNPRRNVPRAIIWSIAFLGLFLVVGSWGILSGWGTNNVDSLVKSEELPAFVLAHQFWGAGWVLILLALVNSALAGCIAYLNVGTRMWYAMSRSGSLPRFLSKVHPEHRTPVNAIAVEIVLNLAVGLGVAWWIGPFNSFVFFGLAITLSLVPVYIAGNIGAFFYYRRERRDEFNMIWHAVFPLVGSAALIWLFYKSVFPLPDSPNNWAVWLVVVWVLLGVGVLLWMRTRGKEDWLLRAGAVVQELPLESEKV